MKIVDQLLRDRAAVLDRIDAGVELAALARAMIVTIAVAMALVGAAIGSYRGGAQIAYAAIKLPLLLLGTAALCAPTLTALSIAMGRPASLRRDVARLLVALGFGALILLALAPVLLLCRALEIGYHKAALVMLACFAASGATAIAVLVASLQRGAGPARGLVAPVVIVFALVGAQLSWTLRPYLVRPRTHQVPFVRQVEGSLYDAVVRTARSARREL